MALLALFLIPLSLACVLVVHLSAGVFAATSAAREGARVAVLAPDEPSAVQAAELAARLAFADQGLPAGSVDIECSALPCLQPGARLTVIVRSTVLGVPITSSASAPVSEFYG